MVIFVGSINADDAEHDGTSRVLCVQEWQLNLGQLGRQHGDHWAVARSHCP